MIDTIKPLKRLFLVSCFLLLASCNNSNERDWNISLQSLNDPVEIIDVRKDFYSSMTLENFRKKYPFYLQENVSDSTYQAQRTDPAELEVNAAIDKIIPKIKLQEELTLLFQHIQHYFPKFKTPKVYLVNAMYFALPDENERLQKVSSPILYIADENQLFIPLDCFLGNGNKYYNSKEFYIENYIQKSMNPENILPKTALAISQNVVPFDNSKKVFLNYIMYYGKQMLLQDAFLPNTSDALKLGYTDDNIDWCYSNEKNMWDYFIRNDYLYSDNDDLLQRFIYPAPFSKFFTADEDNQSVDLESPGQAGIWLGWQIMRKYANTHQEENLAEILANTNFQQQFENANYKPE